MAGRKKSDKIGSLPPKKQKYVRARIAGKNKKESALEAGFPMSMALSAKPKIETPDVQAALDEFRDEVRKTIPIRRCIERLSEGLDATRLFVSGKGDEAYVETEPDFKERREYLKLTTEWGGYVPKESSGGVVVPIQVVIGEW